MTIYILLFFIPMAMAFVMPSLSNIFSRFGFYLFGVFLVLFVGLRYEVGVDWDNYLIHLNDAINFPFYNNLNGGDLGYAVFNWMAAKLGFGIWFVNLLSAVILFVCLFEFSAKLPNPWLVLTVSVPYLIVVFSMNYTRQSIGVAFLFVALLALEEKKIHRFLLYIIIGSLFHKSAVMLLALALFIKNRNILFVLFSVSLVGVLGFFVVLAETADSLVNQYIVEEMSSSGATARVVLGAIPAAIFIFLRKRFDMSDERKRIIFLLSFASIFFVPMVVFTPYSTAIDRVALYLIPLQLYVYSYLPELFGETILKNIVAFFISACYFFMLIFWMAFSQYAEYWIPYRFYPL